MIFLNLPFRSHIVLNWRLIPLVKSLETDQDTVKLLVLTLLVSDFHSVRWATQPLLNLANLLK